MNLVAFCEKFIVNGSISYCVPKLIIPEMLRVSSAVAISRAPRFVPEQPLVALESPHILTR